MLYTCWGELFRRAETIYNLVCPHLSRAPFPEVMPVKPVLRSASASSLAEQASVDVVQALD
ncbi:unnamed protein product [Protopolystoma xenopodis]|uniref:Uncharacterized protein n=1 Tax=Protopolystoma xenopodis TaxID=117903 RepID=A0A3S5B8D4_9PLAT|nr:unnamed protein product [Protopolystoma xenopodis]